MKKLFPNINMNVMLNSFQHRVVVRSRDPEINSGGRNIKITLTIFIFFILSILSSGYKKPDVYKIDATKNAYIHNNLGLRYIYEGRYPAAVQEFKIAISLNPNTQATAVYYNNLGDTYMKMGLFKYAQDCYERALIQYSLNFQYYRNLVECFKAQNLVEQKIKFYSNSKKTTHMIMLGLLYIEKGEVNRGIIKLDEFCMQEPDLLITGAVKNYLKEVIKSLD